MSLRQALITIGMVVGSATLAITQVGCARTEAPTSGIVFTADEEGKAISVVNPETGQVETTGIGISPHNVQVSSDGRTLYAVGSPMVAGQAMGDGMADRGRLLVFDATKVSRGPTADIHAGRPPILRSAESRHTSSWIRRARVRSFRTLEITPSR